MCFPRLIQLAWPALAFESIDFRLCHSTQRCNSCEHCNESWILSRILCACLHRFQLTLWNLKGKSNASFTLNGKLYFSWNWKHKVHWCYCTCLCSFYSFQTVLLLNVSLYHYTWALQWTYVHSTTFKPFRTSTSCRKNDSKIQT